MEFSYFSRHRLPVRLLSPFPGHVLGRHAMIRGHRAGGLRRIVLAPHLRLLGECRGGVMPFFGWKKKVDFWEFSKPTRMGMFIFNGDIYVFLLVDYVGWWLIFVDCGLSMLIMDGWAGGMIWDENIVNGKALKLWWTLLLVRGLPPTREKIYTFEQRKSICLIISETRVPV